MGISFNKPIKLNEKAALGRVDIITTDDSFIISWIQIKNDNCNLVLRKVSQTGKLSNIYFVDDISCDRSGGNPKMEIFGTKLFIAWTIAETGIETHWLDLDQF